MLNLRYVSVLQRLLVFVAALWALSPWAPLQADQLRVFAEAGTGKYSDSLAEHVFSRGFAAYGGSDAPFQNETGLRANLNNLGVEYRFDRFALGSLYVGGFYERVNNRNRPETVLTSGDRARPERPFTLMMADVFRHDQQTGRGSLGFEFVFFSGRFSVLPQLGYLHFTQHFDYLRLATDLPGRVDAGRARLSRFNTTFHGTPLALRLAFQLSPRLRLELEHAGADRLGGRMRSALHDYEAGPGRSFPLLVNLYALSARGLGFYRSSELVLSYAYWDHVELRFGLRESFLRQHYERPQASLYYHSGNTDSATSVETALPTEAFLPVRLNLENSANLFGRDFTTRSRYAFFSLVLRVDLGSRSGNNGYGLRRAKNGDVYSGNFRSGSYHGAGVLHGNDGSRTRGTWRAGTQQGRGEYAGPDGTVYHGDWQDGRPHGQGSMRWKNGARYTGQFVRGRPHGPGRMSWPDGTGFQGMFRNGLKHGVGTLRRPDGTRRTGLWRNDAFIQ